MGLFGLFKKKDNDILSRKKNKDGTVDTVYKDGTKEKRRTTKTRVVWDYERPDGKKGSLYQMKWQYLAGGNKKFWKDDD